jgi:hypothetical protein
MGLPSKAKWVLYVFDLAVLSEAKWVPHVSVFTRGFSTFLTWLYFVPVTRTTTELLLHPKMRVSGIAKVQSEFLTAPLGRLEFGS